MGGLFHPDGAFARYGAKLWDMMWLNLLTVVCSLPVFTAGAAMTAMHYVLLKIFRDEEGAITAAFFKAFRENFKQSTVIGILFAVAAYLLVLSAGIAYALSMAVLAVVVCAWNWSVVFQSRYRNTISGTVRYSLLALAAHPVRSAVMLALFVVPIAAVLAAPKNLILVLLIGFTLPGFVQVCLYHPVLRKLETVKETDPEKE